MLLEFIKNLVVKILGKSGEESYENIDEKKNSTNHKKMISTAGHSNEDPGQFFQDLEQQKQISDIGEDISEADMTIEYQKNSHKKEKTIFDIDPKMRKQVRKQRLLKIAEEKQKNADSVIVKPELSNEASKQTIETKLLKRKRKQLHLEIIERKKQQEKSCTEAVSTKKETQTEKYDIAADPKMRRQVRKQLLLKIAEEKRKNSDSFMVKPELLNEASKQTIETKLLKRKRKQLHLEIIEQKKQQEKSCTEAVSVKTETEKYDIAADPKMRKQVRKQQLLKIVEEKRKNKNLLEKNVKPLIEESAQVSSASIESLSENRIAQEAEVDTDKFFADEEKRVRMKLEMEGHIETKARTETPAHKKYKKESENKPRTQSFVSNEEIIAHDKKMKRWKKSVVELDTGDDPLLESIIHQLKDLREAYAGDYPLGFITLKSHDPP